MDDTIEIDNTQDQATEPLVAAIESAIGAIQQRLADNSGDAQGIKWSVADLVRLVQLRKEMRGSEPNNIIVGWVDNLEAYEEANRQRNSRN